MRRVSSRIENTYKLTKSGPVLHPKGSYISWYCLELVVDRYIALVGDGLLKINVCDINIHYYGHTPTGKYKRHLLTIPDKANTISYHRSNIYIKKREYTRVCKLLADLELQNAAARLIDSMHS